MSKQEITQLRRQAGKVAGGGAGGRCLTTTLGMELGLRDPAVDVRLGAVREWIGRWQRFPRIHRRVAMAWHAIKSRLLRLGAKRWRAARGPT
eukprot:2697328-Pyramimonas_sp.AAC.1